MLLPRRSVPELRVPTLAHGDFDLAADAPKLFTLICFYRGLHCPVCLKYLRDLESLIPEYERRGTKVIAISSDVRERAQEMANKVGASLRFGYSLPLAVARKWGLYRVERHRSILKSRHCFRSPAYSSSDRMVLCITARFKQCRSHVRCSRNCFRQSISLSPGIIRRVASMTALSKRPSA
ncbi:peroxiredoxin [Bradyrhizobium japonicum]|uniref:redoxin domain-containing protein n=1 Tax=Bradyrhizobium TaxID=374 RepID=UPI002814B82B|nr:MULTISPECIES: redoxin domain-containing protein [Bradyrhizobium]MCP1743737.1 peroxiredoxin [Bradyrhizobium japonicum]MCP1861451.1 peroxiredoxin [Bradyrhizobium japonicum]MCP1892211.1 peroxiredoxin [Bradyrhizobium japonicum]MCW2325333.1 peroxiredoxin [Bradyrhizobium japonicum]